MLRNRVNVSGIFALVGGLIIIIALLVHPGFWKDIIKDIGVVIFSIAMIDLLWHWLGGDPVGNAIAKLHESNALVVQADRCGLIGVGAKREDLWSPTEIRNMILASKSNIDLCGWTLYLFTENHNLMRALVERASDGVRVRVLVGHPKNPFLEGSVKQSLLNQMREQMNVSIAEFGGHQSQSSNFVTRAIRDKTIAVSLLRFDDKMQVTPYLVNYSTEVTPRYNFLGLDREVFERYLREFEELFKLAETVPIDPSRPVPS
jgi:hypothetical protein